MRCVGMIAAAFAAGLAFCGVQPAFAESDEPGDTAAHFLFFGGADIWRNGGFTHGGFLWAHQGLDRDGLVFKLLLNGGLYRFQSNGSEITGRQMMVAALPGWRWRRDGLEITAFAGLDVQDHRFTPDDPGNRLRGTHAGARGGFDIWYEPFRDAMLTGSVSASTIGMSYWTRAAAGWRFFNSIWLGPEVHAMGDDNYRQFRIGAHVTSLRLWSYEFSVGGGWATDSDQRSSAYGRFGMIYRPSDKARQQEKAAAPF